MEKKVRKTRTTKAKVTEKVVKTKDNSIDQRIDIVIPFKETSNIGNMEIIFCLRGIEKYVKNYRNIIFVGDCPKIINKDSVIHIKKDKNYKFINKEQDIAYSLSLCATDDRVSDNFVMFNDDFYTNNDIDITKLPTYTRPYDLHEHVYGEDRKHLRWFYYTNVILYTLNHLQALNLPIINYDIHKPMMFNKHKVKELYDNTDWSVTKHLGYAFRSLYGNTYNLPATISNDLKFNQVTEKVKEIIKDEIFWSSGDKITDTSFIPYMSSILPNKSKYEL